MSDTNTTTALENLQKQVESQRKQIDKLSQDNAKLREKVKKLEGGGNAGGVETGPSRAGAAAALAAKLGGVPKPKGGGGGGVETGPSRGAAAALLMGKLAKKNNGGGGKSEEKGGDEKDKIFAKYEKMMKLGISIHGALGRMVQNGEKSDMIDAFKKKHAAKLGGTQDDSHDLEELGLKPKRKIIVQRNIKMKRLHWDPINPTRVPNSIWEDLDESTIKYDPKKFELNFQVRERKQVVQESTKANHSNPNEKRFFVPKKRAQQVMIGIRGLGLTNKQLRDVLHNMDEKVMKPEKLTQLMDIVPTEDEQTQAEKEVMAHNGNYKQFGESEQFFFNLCDFYHLEQRLRLWMFKMQFRELTSNLLEQFKQVQKTCDKVRNNKNLKQLLTIILAFGNHMNAGTRKGEAFGFDLKILATLPNVKTHDNSRSLLMYMYEFCDNKYPKVLDVLKDLKPILKISASTETDTLNTLYDKIKENMKELKDIIESDDIEESYDPDDSYVKVMQKFYKQSQSPMKKFHMTVGNVLVSSKRLMKKFAFGAEEQPEPVEKLFSLLYQFLLDLEISKQKLVKLEAERAKKRRLRLKRKKNLQKNNKQKGGLSVKTGGLKKPGNGNNNDDESKDSSWDWDKYKGGTLHKALDTKLAFEEELSKAKNALTKHIKNKSSFVAAGGDLSKLGFVDERRVSTMRRVSSAYQQDQEEARKMAEARQKARLAKLQKGMKLPALPDNYRSGRIANHAGLTPTSDNTPIPETGRYGAIGRQSPGIGGYQPGKDTERDRRGTPAFPQALMEYNSPLPDNIGIAAPKKFDRPTRSPHTQTAPSIQAGVQLNPRPDSGATPPTKPLPKGFKDKKLPPNKQIPPPPNTGSTPNLHQSQTQATHSPTNAHSSHHSNKNKKHHHSKKNKHKGPASPQHSQQNQQQYTPSQQQWMSQHQSQPNLYNNQYAQQGGAQGQPPQGQWTQAQQQQNQQQWNQYYAQQAQYAQQWNQYYAQQAAQQGQGGAPQGGQPQHR